MTLCLLAAIFAVSNMDRQVLSISLNAIGREFQLNDTQLGLLSGFVFAIVFISFGLIAAWLAAIGNRRNLIAVSVALWSALTLATAAAQNFTHLIVARMGVGIGEAGGVAPAHSIISDLYPEHERTGAMALFVAGGNAGILLAFLIGGIAGQFWGWRWAFVVVALPGLLLAVALRLWGTEPVRDQSGTASGPGNRSLLIRTLWAIWHDKGLLHVIAGVSLTGMITFGALAWNAVFIIRVHHLSVLQTGLFLAATMGIAGAAVTFFSGRLADRLATGNPRWRLGLVAAAILFAKPFVIGFLLIDNTEMALGCFVLSSAVASVFWAPSFAHLHARLTPELRPMGTAIFLFAFNLIGLGLGPALIGWLSDNPFAGQGPRSIGYGLLVVQLTGAWAAWHYWRAMKTVQPAQR